MSDEVAALKVKIQGDISELQTSIKRLESELEGLNKTVQKNNNEATQSYEQVGKSVKSVGDGIDSVTKSVQGVALGLAAGGIAAAKFAVDFEDSFAAVKKTVDATPGQIEKIKQGIIDLSTVGLDGRSAIPMTTTELNELASAAGQLGVEAENILTFTETVAQMGTATNLVGSDGASTMARFLNVMGLGNDVVSNLGSALVDLGNNSATTEAEIAEMALRMGKFGATVGIGAADVLGYSAALSSMGIEAQAGGSSIGRVWLSIEEAVANGGAALSAFAKNANMSAQEFAKSWSTDSKGTFNSLLKGMKEGTEQGEELVLMLSELGISNTLDQQAVMALVNGFDLTAESVERANTAWEENSALQTEFNAKAETTASKLEIARNNLVEAGRSIGESFLPMVSDAAVNVAEFAQGIASMDEETKQTILSVGKWVIGLGLASKGVAGGLKTVGGAMESIANIKSAFSVGGALAKFAPALTKIGAVAGPAAIGIAAVGTAVWAGKKAYDAWYDSQYRWSKGLSEGNEKIKESLDEYKQLSSIQGKIKDLKLVIENPESSREQVETAQSRLEEIKKLLSEEYNLVINSDNSNLDGAVETAKEINKNKTKIAVNEQIDRMQGLRPKFEEYQSEYESLNKQLSDAIEKQDLYTKASLELSEVQSRLKAGTYEYNRAVADIGVKYGLVKETAVSAVDALAGNTKIFLNSELSQAGKDIEDINDNLTNLTASYEEYRAIATEAANWETELLGLSALEGDAEGVSDALNKLGSFIRLAGLDMHGYAQAAALAMNGVESLESAWEKAASGDGAALNGIVNDYIRASSEFGASAQKTATGAALIKNGFRSIDEAVRDNKLDIVIQQANEIADSMEGMEGFDIEINASGDISLIEEASGYVKELQLSNGVNIKVDASQAIAVIDGVEHKIVKYDGTTGTATLTADGKSASMTINLLTGEVTTFDTLEGETVLSAIDNVTETAEEAARAIAGIKDKKVKITATFVQQSEEAFGIKFARGTSDAPGGLAMINDQRGVSDPRELVEVDGQGYIFEGRDVVLPLPKHSKVYTAAQTKAIMSGKGIPHYAEGKDNEAFEAAKDDWSHYTKINNVSAKEALAHWNSLLEQFSYDAEAVKEIQEEIASSTRDMWDDELEAMKYALDMGWISEKEYYEQLWQYRDANFEQWSDEYKDITLELKEYNDKLAEEERDANSEMFKNRLQESWDWLVHEEKYNNLSAEDYIAGLERMEAYTDDYYRQGIITYEEWVEAMGDINDAKLDKMAEGATNAADELAGKISAWESDAALYLRESQTLGWDWLNNGDSEVAYYQRMAKKYQDYLDTGGLNDEQYAEIQKKRREAELDAYSAAAAEFEELLSGKMEEINDMQTKYSDRINALRESWDTEDRRDSIDDVQKQLRIYENAVTQEGREEYERLQEELKGLEREEQIYQLEQESAAAVKRLEAEYERLEASKEAAIGNILGEATAFNTYISGVQKTTIGIEGILSKLDAGTFASMLTSLGEIKAAIDTAAEKLDIDVNINNSFTASDSSSLIAGAKILNNQLYSNFGGR